MPSRTISESSASALSSTATCLYFRPSSFACSSNRSCICIKPNAYRGRFSIWICYHRRVKLAVLQDKDLITDTCLCRRLILSYPESLFVIDAYVIIAENDSAISVGSAIILVTNKSCFRENFTRLFFRTKGINKPSANFKTCILLAFNDIGKGVESVTEPVWTVSCFL